MFTQTVSFITHVCRQKESFAWHITLLEGFTVLKETMMLRRLEEWNTLDLVTVFDAIMTSRQANAWEITVFVWESNVE